VQTVLKSGSLNLLVLSGPVQDCNGIALPYTYLSVTVKGIERKVITEMNVCFIYAVSVCATTVGSAVFVRNTEDKINSTSNT
jgi:hypothetical protein